MCRPVGVGKRNAPTPPVLLSTQRPKELDKRSPSTNTSEPDGETSKRSGVLCPRLGRVRKNNSFRAIASAKKPQQGEQSPAQPSTHATRFSSGPQALS